MLLPNRVRLVCLCVCFAPLHPTDANNAKILEKIETCIFVLCLDDAVHELPEDKVIDAKSDRDDVSFAMQVSVTVMDDVSFAMHVSHMSSVSKTCLTKDRYNNNK